MSVEIWKGVCRGSYDTSVSLFPKQGQVWIDQEGGGSNDAVCMDESEAIDIALCILKELVPGFMQNEAGLVQELARYKAAYGHLENEVRMLPKE